MAGSVVENLSNRKILVLGSFLSVCLLVCFLLGGLVGRFQNNIINCHFANVVSSEVGRFWLLNCVKLFVQK